jgi:hypothetical protein
MIPFLRPSPDEIKAILLDAEVFAQVTHGP